MVSVVGSDDSDVIGFDDSSVLLPASLPIEHAESRNALARVSVSAAVTFFLVLNISSSFR
jgi:hypothetical protein